MPEISAVEVLELTRYYLKTSGSSPSRWEIHRDLMDLARSFSKGGGDESGWIEGLSEYAAEDAALFPEELSDIWNSAHGEKLVGSTLFANADSFTDEARPKSKQPEKPKVEQPKLWAKAEDLVKPAIERLYKFAAKDFSDKVPTGLAVLDDRLEGGWHRKGYSILAAPSGLGKTTSVFQFAGNALSKGLVALICSPEMDAEVLLTRELCRRAGVSKTRFSRNERDQARVASQVGSFKGQDLFLTITRQLSREQLATSAGQVKEAAGRLDLIVLDYAQFFGDADSPRRWADLTKFVEWTTTGLAQAYDAAVLITSQVNVNKDGDYELREARSIHNKAEADLHFKSPKERDPYAPAVQAQFWLAKNRHGPALCSVPVTWYPGEFRISEGEEL